jgi:hypothetical protein
MIKKISIEGTPKTCTLIEELKEKIAELQADKNKLINYIAVRENKTHEDVCKKFEV